MSETTILKEFSHIHCNKDAKDRQDGNVYVEKSDFDAIKKFVLKNSDKTYILKPSYKKGLGETLQARNYVGVLQMKNGKNIEILPKIANENNEKELRKILIKMIKTLKSSHFKISTLSHLKTFKMPLFEVFISMFLDELTLLLKKGLMSDYILHEENLNFLKGKLKINEQIIKNYIHKERFFTQYDEFSINRVENRLIKTTLKFLFNKSKFDKNKQKIQKFLAIFEDVELSFNTHADFSKVKPNRQISHYEQTLIWCKIFLQDKSFSSHEGNDLAYAILFDMNKLFEAYVGYKLKKVFQDVRLQDRGKYLIEEPKKFELKPDIVTGKDIIADTKWKIIKKDDKNNKVSQSDLYQLYAYAKKYNAKKLYLIYPYTEDLPYIKELKYEKDLILKIVFYDLKDDVFYFKQVMQDTSCLFGC